MHSWLSQEAGDKDAWSNACPTSANNTTGFPAAPACSSWAWSAFLTKWQSAKIHRRKTKIIYLQSWSYCHQEAPNTSKFTGWFTSCSEKRGYPKPFMFFPPHNKQMPKAEQVREKKILCEFLIKIRARNNAKQPFLWALWMSKLWSSVAIWIVRSDALGTE